jgi:integrase
MKSSGFCKTLKNRLSHDSNPEGADNVLKGVHNLRHTFAHRPRAAGAPNETRKVLLGHTQSDITAHYPAATFKELLEAAERHSEHRIG